MRITERIHAFVQLGKYLENVSDKLESQMKQAALKNPWFTHRNSMQALDAWARLLSFKKLQNWLDAYSLSDCLTDKKILIVMAGNIPLVGFHDLLCVLISGHKAVIKTSRSDDVLLPALIQKLCELEPLYRNQIHYIEDVKDHSFDGVIATGSDNSAQYFEYYFKDSKRIIRKNRRSIAVLDGSETEKQLEGFSKDVFSYFGLGCRSVSTVFIPKGYDLDLLFSAFFPFKDLIYHKKYANNYDYNKAIYLMGNHKITENGFILLKEQLSLHSPVAVLYYNYYNSRDEVVEFISQHKHQLQCVISSKDTPFGQSQSPLISEYADGVDTLDFLQSI